jgi:hypothetical protein
MQSDELDVFPSEKGKSRRASFGLVMPESYQDLEQSETPRRRRKKKRASFGLVPPERHQGAADGTEDEEVSDEENIESEYAALDIAESPQLCIAHEYDQDWHTLIRTPRKDLGTNPEAIEDLSPRKHLTKFHGGA